MLIAISAALTPLVECTVSTYIQELCTTGHGTKLVAPVPTTTHALTLDFYPLVLSTLTPVTTVTPAATTLDVTAFTTSTLVESVVREEHATDPFTRYIVLSFIPTYDW